MKEPEYQLEQEIHDGGVKLCIYRPMLSPEQRQQRQKELDLAAAALWQQWQQAQQTQQSEPQGSKSGKPAAEAKTQEKA